MAHAPKDVVHYTISGKQGMMTPRDAPLAASEREQTFVLYPGAGDHRPVSTDAADRTTCAEGSGRQRLAVRRLAR